LSLIRYLAVSDKQAGQDTQQAIRDGRQGAEQSFRIVSPIPSVTRQIHIIDVLWKSESVFEAPSERGLCREIQVPGLFAVGIEISLLEAGGLQIEIPYGNK